MTSEGPFLLWVASLAVASLLVRLAKRGKKDTRPLGLAGETAHALGGTLSPGRRSEVAGTIDGCAYRVRFGFIPSVEVTRAIPASLTLYEKPPRSAFVSDVKLGDPNFDEVVRVYGPSDLLHAVLDEATRRETVHAVAALGMRIDGGRVRWSTSLPTSAAELAAIVRAAAALATRFSVDESRVADRLAANLLTESSPEIRRRILRALAERYRGHPAAERAARHAIADPVPDVRLAAATLGAGPEATQALRDLAVAAVPEDVRVRALREVIPRLGDDLLAPLLTAALESDRSAVAVEALVAARRAGIRLAPGTLLRQLAASHPAARAAAAASLDPAGAPEVEAALLQVLGRDDDDVIVAALEALGRGASLAAVERILPLTRGLLTPEPIRRAATEALRRIQERAGGARGQLSLDPESPGARGRVTLAVPAGAVSIAGSKKPD